MPSVNIENGKRIEDLMEISTFSTSAHFLVSEHNLTRKTNLTSLRNMFNGDTAIEDLNNVYYSVEKINEFLDNVNDEFSKLTERLDTLNLKIQDIYTNLGADLDEFKKKMELMYNELITADGDLLEYIKEQIKIEKEARIEADTQLQYELINESTIRENHDTVLNNLINDEITNRTNADTNLQSQINNEITNRTNADTNLQTQINNEITARSSADSNLQSQIYSLSSRIAILEAKFSYGTSAPTSLTNGYIYFQYF